MSQRPDMLTAALWYAQQGVPVLPLNWPVEQAMHYVCACGDPSCSSPAKHPRGDLVPHGKDDASTDPDVIRRWWTKYPRANIGLRTGVVFDALDLDGLAGTDAYEQIVRAFGEDLASLAIVQTGRPDGGLHHYCRPAGHKSFTGGKNGIPKGLDCRGQGGYVVAVPSMYITGKRYQWVKRWSTAQQHADAGAEWDAVYDWITALSKSNDDTQAFDDPAKRQHFDTPAVISAPYASAALAREAANVAGTLPGGRNDQLNRSAYSIGQLVAVGAIPGQTAHDTLADAARTAGLPANETERTLQSGLSKGAQNPRTMPQQVPLAEQSANGRTLVTTEQDDSQAQAERDQRELAWEIRQQRIKRDARRQLAQEDAAARFPWEDVLTQRDTLAVNLAEPRRETPYTVTDIMPRDANVLLIAQYKTGKTTLINNVARALADRTPMLDRFDVISHDGRVVIFNLEMSEGQYVDWWRDIDVQHPERITLVNLRGVRLPLRARLTQEWMVNHLIDMECETWIVDPFARLFNGFGDENSNSDVGEALEIVDQIKREAKVPNLIMATHTGRALMVEGAERARGATRLDDWPDVRWLLTKNEDGQRFLAANGRDVEVDEEELTFDVTTRRLVFGGGSREWVRARQMEDDILDYVSANPGCSANAIKMNVRGKGQAIINARHRLRDQGKIVCIESSSREPIKHYIAGQQQGV